MKSFLHIILQHHGQQTARILERTIMIFSAESLVIKYSSVIKRQLWRKLGKWQSYEAKHLISVKVFILKITRYEFITVIWLPTNLRSILKFAIYCNLQIFVQMSFICLYKFSYTYICDSILSPFLNDYTIKMKWKIQRN